MSQAAEKQVIQAKSKQEGRISQPDLSDLVEWEINFRTDLQENRAPLGQRVFISEKDIVRIELFLINTPRTSQVPLDAEKIRWDVLEAMKDPTHPKSSYAHHQLPKNMYPKVIELINAIHAIPFDNDIKDLEGKYRTWVYRDYRLLIEIEYRNREMVEILTTPVFRGNFLLANIIQNQRSHYLILDTKGVDALMKYIDPEITMWEWVRPYIIF